MIQAEKRDAMVKSEYQVGDCVDFKTTRLRQNKSGVVLLAEIFTCDIICFEDNTIYQKIKYSEMTRSKKGLDVFLKIVRLSDEAKQFILELQENQKLC